MAAPVSGPPPLPGGSGRRGLAWSLGWLVVDVALAVALLARAWEHPSRITAGARQDAPYTVWALAWVARAVTHGQSPWISHALSWPGGVNLLTNATATGLGLLLTPVTRWWGPLVAYNVIATAGLALTAWSATLVLRRALWVSWPAAGVGGLVAGFGATSMVQVTGDHLHIAAAFLVPPLLLGIGRLATGTARHPWRWGLGVGLLAAAQLLVGEEVLAIAAVAAAAALLLGVRWIAWSDLARGGAVAAIVFGAAAAVPLAVQFRGTQAISGPILRGDRYADDLTAFIVPVRQLWLRTAATDRIAAHASSEQGAYLGIPLVVVVGAATAWAWRRRMVRVIGATVFVVALLSLGARLTVAGHRTTVPLPWALAGHVPLLQSLLPARFGLVLDLGAGALLAVLLDLIAATRAAVAGGPGRDEATHQGDQVRHHRDRARHQRDRARHQRDRARHHRDRARHRRDRARHQRRPPGATVTRRIAAVGAAVGVAAVCLVPLLPALPFRATEWAVPAAFRSPARLGVPDGRVVVLSPYPSGTDPQIEVWLAAAGDRWESAGGTYFVPDAHRRVTIGGPPRTADVVDSELEAGTQTASSLAYLAGAVTDELRRDRVAAVLVGPGPHRDQVILWWTQVLGPPAQTGGLQVWHLS